MSGAQFVSTPARLLVNVCEPKLAQIFSWCIRNLSAYQIQDHIQNPQLKGVLAEVGIVPLQLGRKRQMCAILRSLEEEKQVCQVCSKLPLCPRNLTFVFYYM